MCPQDKHPCDPNVVFARTLQVNNKRTSYEAFTQCLDDHTQPFALEGVTMGVWVARAYLVPIGAQKHWRGGHRERYLGTEDTSWFVVDEDNWRAEARLDEWNGVPTGLLEGKTVTSAGTAADLERQTFQRLRVFDVANAMLSSASVTSAIKHTARQAGHRRRLALSMANEGHLDLTLNLLASMRRCGAAPALVFALDDATELALTAAGAPLARVPLVESYPLPAGRRDVWSKGFADIAVLKPVCVLTVLRLGVDALWLDTDIVVFSDPLMALAIEGADVEMQAGGSSDIDVPEDDIDALRSELCSGLYLARASNRTQALFEHTVHVLALHQTEVRFGDQSATNLAIHEARWRQGLRGLSLSVLSPLRWPTGGVYFTLGEPARRGITPVLVHNNYLIGHAAKVSRFRDHGLWLVDDSSPTATLCGATALLPPLLQGAAAQAVLGEPMEACPLVGGCRATPSSNVLWFHPCPVDERRLLVVVSLGDRPWVGPLVLPRLRRYAATTRSDLLFVATLHRCTGPGIDGNACAKRAKLEAAAAALAPLPAAPISCQGLCGYSRVAVVDDTMLFRSDAPDVFDLVPAPAVGAAVEDSSVRTPEATAYLARLAVLQLAGPSADELLLDFSGGNDGIDTLIASGALAPLGCAQASEAVPDDARFFNSGFLVLSAAHHCLVSGLSGMDLDFVVLWDQGLLNARRRLAKIPLYDLGLRLNWLGSFNGTNSHRRPCDLGDAFAVHATTGLPSFGSGRLDFLTYVDKLWASSGI